MSERPLRRGNAATLTEGGVFRTLLSMAWPMLFGIVAIMTFNLVDAIYVARLGTVELAALSFTFPVVIFVAGLTLGLGVGLTSIVSREIGAGRIDQVRRLTRDGLLFAILVVACLSVLGLFTIDQIFGLMGADAEVLPLLRGYMSIWYLGIVFLVVPMVGNSAIRATGDARSPALIMSASALLNMALDPLFIFGPGPFPALGLTGAAVASVISRVGTLVVSLWILLRRERLVELSLPRPSELLRNWGEILAVGLPAAFTNVLAPVSLAMLPYLVSREGHAATAGFGAGGRLQQFALVIPIAWCSGLTPFVGQNWGAGLAARVRAGLQLSMRLLAAGGLLVYLCFALTARPLAAAMTPDPAARDYLATFLRLAMIGYPFASLIFVGNSALNALRRPLRAASLNLLRLFVCLIPLAWIGSLWRGAEGVFLSISVANLLTGLMAWLWLRSIGGPGDQPASPTGPEGGAEALGLPR